MICDMHSRMICDMCAPPARAPSRTPRSGPPGPGCAPARIQLRIRPMGAAHTRDTHISADCAPAAPLVHWETHIGMCARAIRGKRTMHHARAARRHAGITWRHQRAHSDTRHQRAHSDTRHQRAHSDTRTRGQTFTRMRRSRRQKRIQECVSPYGRTPAARRVPRTRPRARAPGPQSHIHKVAWGAHTAMHIAMCSRARRHLQRADAVGAVDDQRPPRARRRVHALAHERGSQPPPPPAGARVHSPASCPGIPPRACCSSPPRSPTWPRRRSPVYVCVARAACESCCRHGRKSRLRAPFANATAHITANTLLHFLTTRVPFAYAIAHTPHNTRMQVLTMRTMWCSCGVVTRPLSVTAAPRATAPRTTSAQSDCRTACVRVRVHVRVCACACVCMRM